MFKRRGQTQTAIRPVEPSRALVPWRGERVDVDRFWAEAWVDLDRRQKAVARKLKIGKAEWSVNQDAGLIQFDRPDGRTVIAPVQIIGSWNPRNSNFTWAWDHPSVHTRLRADAERTRWFGEKHDVPELMERTLRMSEQDAWKMTSVAMKVNAAVGAYSGITEGPIVFMTFGQPKVKD